MAIKTLQIRRSRTRWILEEEGNAHRARHYSCAMRAQKAAAGVADKLKGQKVLVRKHLPSDYWTWTIIY